MNKKIMLAPLMTLMCVGCGANLSLNIHDEIHYALEDFIKDSHLTLLSSGVDMSLSNIYPTDNDTFPIVDVDNPGFKKLLYPKPQTESGSKTIEKNSIEAFSKDYAASFGVESEISGEIPNYASGNVAAKFNYQNHTKNFVDKEERFSMWYFSTRTMSYNVAWDNENLEQYFTDGFVNDLNNMQSLVEATEFLTRYGSHVFDKYSLGGRIEVTKYYAKEKNYKETSNQTEMSANSSISANISGIMANAKASQSATFNDTRISNSESEYCEVACETYGGINPISNPDDLFTYNQNYVEESKYEYEKWSEQFLKDDAKVTVIDCKKPRSIWSLLPENKYSKQKALLEQAFTVKELTAFAGNDQKYGYGSGYFDSLNCQTEGDPIVVDLHSTDVYLPNKINFSVNISEALTQGIDTSDFKLVSTAPDITTIDGLNVSINNTSNIPSFSLKLMNNDKVLNTLKVTLRESDYSFGYGTLDQPYLINDRNDFEKFVNDVSNHKHKYFKLGNDIDLEGNDYKISLNSDGFQGSFDGDNHILSNFNVLTHKFVDNKTSIGLFPVNKGTIKNLVIRDAAVVHNGIVHIGKSSKNVDFGVLTGRNEGTIDNCRVYNSSIKATAKSDNDKAYLNTGIIAGRSTGEITNCAVADDYVYTRYSDKGNLTVGGLIGYANGGLYANNYSTNCYIKSNWDNNNHTMGSLFGTITNAKVQNSLAYGTNEHLVIKKYHGLIAGYAKDTAFESCYCDDTPVASGEYVGCKKLYDVKLSTISNSDFDRDWMELGERVILKCHLGDYDYE